MKRLLFFLFLLFVSVCIGALLYKNSGYVLFAYGNWTVESPLWLVVALLIISFLIFYWMVKIIKYGREIPLRWQRWSTKRHERRLQYLTNKGLIEFAEGEWVKAEKDLLKGVNPHQTPLINFLTAAKAAQELGAYQRRDDYLRRAYQSNPTAQIAIGLTQAQLQLQHNQLEQALATLKHLRDLSPKHAYVLKLLQRVYWELQDWDNLIKLIPELKKYKVISREEAKRLQQVIADKQH